MIRKITLLSVVALLAVLIPTAAYSQAGTPVALDKIRKIPVYNEVSDADFLEKTKIYTETPMNDKYLSYEIRLPKEWNKLDLGEDSGVSADDEQGGGVKFVLPKKMAAQKKAFVERENKLLNPKDSLPSATSESEGGQASGDSSDPNAMSSKILGTIAKYYSPSMVNVTNSILTIDAQELKYDISTKNWFLNFILSNSYTLEGMEILPDGRIEALYVLLDDGISYVIRAVAQINGKRIVLVRMSIPESQWMAQRGMQEKIVRSFHFLAPEKVKIGASRTYAFLDFLKFDYPVMWRLAAPAVTSMDSMDASLLSSDDGQTLQGEIGVHVVANDADATMPDQISTLIDDLKEKGFLVDDLLEEPDYFKAPSQVFYSKIQVYKVKYKSKGASDYEYWISIMREDRYYYYVSLLTISRSANFFTWARNTEAFQQVVETLRP